MENGRVHFLLATSPHDSQVLLTKGTDGSGRGSHCGVSCAQVRSVHHL